MSSAALTSAIGLFSGEPARLSWEFPKNDGQFQIITLDLSIQLVYSEWANAPKITQFRLDMAAHTPVTSISAGSNF